jgi:hypothetical protein
MEGTKFNRKAKQRLKRPEKTREEPCGKTSAGFFLCYNS